MFALDEDLWFGETDDAVAEQNAADSLAARVGRIIGTKPFPVAAKRLEELTRNPSTRIEQIVRVLEGDPALSARLLRLVNSAGYALRLRCTSVRHAAALVGMRRLHQVATTAAVLDMFDANSEAAVEILEHAAVVGSFCRYLGVHLGLPRDELFTCGFLHDIGKLMLLDTEGAPYAALLDQYRGQPDVMHVVERERYGFDHAVLAAHVLSAWNIPDPVPKVVAWHHQVSRAYQAGTTLSAMVQALRLADALSYVVGKVSNYQAVVELAQSEAALYLEISEPQLAAMWDDLMALRQQGRVGARGSDVSELVIMPRRESLPKARLDLQKPKVAEAPKHFPCVACKKPSFGNTCPCCAGHVCPEHQTRAGEWCVLCVREYERSREAARLDTAGQFKVGMLGALIAAAATFASTSIPDAPLSEMILGPLLVVGLCALLYVVARRWRLRTGFLRVRRARPRTLEGALPIDASSTTRGVAISDRDGADSEPELLVIDNSIPPPNSLFPLRSLRVPAPVPSLSEPPVIATPPITSESHVFPSIPCVAGGASNAPARARTAFETYASCSVRAPAHVGQRTQVMQAIVLPQDPAPEAPPESAPLHSVPAESGVMPSSPPMSIKPDPILSIHVPSAGPVPVILINDHDHYPLAEHRRSAPEITVAYTSMIPESDALAATGTEHPVSAASVRLSTWETSSDRP